MDRKKKREFILCNGTTRFQNLPYLLQLLCIGRHISSWLLQDFLQYREEQLFWGILLPKVTL